MSPLIILRPSIFNFHPGIVAAFSTRVGGVSPEPYGLNLGYSAGDDRANVVRNRELFFGKLHIGLDELAFTMQSHTANIVRADAPGGYEASDGLVTGEYGVFLVVSVADCIPVLLFDPVRKAVAAIHAGWRGTAGGVVPNGVKALKTEFGSDPADIAAAIGPGAGKCCYEVGEEVASRFPGEAIDRTGPKPRLNLRGYIADQLRTEGLKNESIEIDKHCTIHDENLFHSYRRDGRSAGRMVGVIGILR